MLHLVRLFLIASVVALLAADWWVASVLFDAAFHESESCERGYDCNGGWLYWAQLAFAAGILLLLAYATWRAWKRLRAASPAVR